MPLHCAGVLGQVLSQSSHIHDRHLLQSLARIDRIPEHPANIPCIECWYKENIPIAEQRYERYIATLEEKN
jgi:hypothetical protein